MNSHNHTEAMSPAARVLLVSDEKAEQEAGAQRNRWLVINECRKRQVRFSFMWHAERYAKADRHSRPKFLALCEGICASVDPRSNTMQGRIRRARYRKKPIAIPFSALVLRTSGIVLPAN